MDVENLQIPLTSLANVLGFFTKSVEQNQLDLFDKISITMEVYGGTPFFIGKYVLHSYSQESQDQI